MILLNDWFFPESDPRNLLYRNTIPVHRAGHASFLVLPESPLALVALSLLHHSVLHFSSLSFFSSSSLSRPFLLFLSSLFAPVPGSFLRLAPSHLTLRSFRFSNCLSPSPLPPPKRTLLSILSLEQQLIISLSPRLHLSLSLFDYRYVLHRTRTGCVSTRLLLLEVNALDRLETQSLVTFEIHQSPPILWTRTNEVFCSE